MKQYMYVCVRRLIVRCYIFGSGVSREPYKSLFPSLFVRSSSVTNFEACDWLTQMLSKDDCRSLC